MQLYLGGYLKSTNEMWAFKLIIMGSLMLLSLGLVEARDKGDDIILTKGKLIMRGGKGKGNLILDTGSKSNEHHVMPMMPMHQFNPFSFYPIPQQMHHQPAPMFHVQPVYLEDHSALHHHQPEHQQHHHHQEYHHEEPHHYQHHEVEHHEMHHQPEHHHEMQHHMPQPEPHHHEEMQHHHQEPVEHHYEHEGHHEEGVHQGGYETHPMMSAMMMHGSGLQPTYEQFAALQAFPHPALLAQHSPEAQRVIEKMAQEQQEKQQLDQSSKGQTEVKDTSGQASNKQVSILQQSGNNPLVAMIRPLFKRNNSANKNKKP